MTSKIEISHRTIIFIVAFLAAVWLVLEIRDILFLLFISFIIMSALRPLVEFLERYKIPRILSIIFIYIVVFGFFGVTISSLIPVLASQTAKFISNLPQYIAAINPYYQIDLRSLTQQIAPISENILKVTIGVFSNIVTLVTVLMFTFYLLMEQKHFENYIIKFLGKQNGEKVVDTVKAAEFSLGAWLRGELILMVCIGLFSYIGLVFLRVEFALPLAIIAGLLEIIPIIGPILSGIPAVLVAFTISPFLALATAALYFIVHQLENNLIVPYVMNKAVGLSPLITIIALMVGSRLAGGTGAILAIPVVVMLRAVIITLLSKNQPRSDRDQKEE